MIMFGYELPLRANQLIMLDCPQQEEQEVGLRRLPMRIRHNQLRDMLEKHKANLELKNEKLRENQYKVGDLVLKQVMQPLMTGTRHALDCRYTGPYEIIALDNSSATLDSPTAKFASPIKCHVDQLKPFILPTSPTISPTWDEALRQQMNLHNNPVSNRLRKRRRPEAATDQTSAIKQAKLTFTTDEDTDTIMDRVPAVKKKNQTKRIQEKKQDNEATITLPDSMIPSLDSDHTEAQEENNKNTSTSSSQKRRVISATRRANKHVAADTVTQAEQQPTITAGETATTPAGEEMDTSSEAAHKKVDDTKTVHKPAEADRSDSPITVSSPQVGVTETEVTGEDSNLSRTKATQTDSPCTSQAVQTTELSQEKV